jgi:hypothetical protein
MGYAPGMSKGIVMIRQWMSGAALGALLVVAAMPASAQQRPPAPGEKPEAADVIGAEPSAAASFDVGGKPRGGEAGAGPRGRVISSVIPETAAFDPAAHTAVRALNPASDRATGSLGKNSATRPDGQGIEFYTVTGRAGQQLRMRLSSADFDTYLRVSGPGGYLLAEDDTTGDGTNSQLTITLPADGTYHVGVSSYGEGSSGDYTLTIGDAAVADIAAIPATRTEAAGPATTIAFGTPVSGSLARSDGRRNGADEGAYADTYRFMGRRGQRVRIDVTSDDFDPIAVLQPPGAIDAIENDDGADVGLNSRIDDVLPADGEYRLTVTSFAPDSTGRYRVAVAPSAGPARIANVRGGQRVFALMVGVSDYGGAANDLADTDDDAIKLTQALQGAGVLNPASMILLNADATTASVRQAFQQVASQAGPDDLFLFFFSGHGVQVDSRVSATEPDGRDETIVMRDGNITDDELSRMFGTVRARMAVAILDSCFSGGFARDLVNRPGVMGFFSSEEDLTSLVAGKYESGGYLAHFVQAGLGGAADGNGDRAISVGELSTFVRARFNAAEVGLLEAETTDGQRNYQNLVIERGGVEIDDILIRLGEAAR